MGGFCTCCDCFLTFLHANFACELQIALNIFPIPCSMHHQLVQAKLAQLQRRMTHPGRKFDRMQEEDDEIKGLAQRICTSALGASALMVGR